VLGGRGRARIRSGLILVQVSLSFILVVASGLLLQSLFHVRTTNPGFTTQGVQFTALDLVSSGYDASRAQTFQDTLIDRVRALPGVESAAFARRVPLSHVSSQEAPIAVDGYTPPFNELPMAEYNEVDSNFFVTLGIPLVSGREFSRGDDESSAPVAVINETMATRFWKDRIPLGDRVQIKGRSYTIVGIAKDAKYDSVRESSRPFFYLSTRQANRSGSVLFVRTFLAPDAVARALAREVHNLDPNLAPYEVITMKEQLDRSTSSQMVAVELVAVLGGLALLLATIGLYGVMSYAVSQSTRELGMRMALGACASDLLQLVLGRGLTLTVAGVFVGAGASLALMRLLGDLLYQVSPRDPLAFGAAFAVIGISSAAACFVPAWRATRTDPLCALRAK
jgi:predicted permease